MRKAAKGAIESPIAFSNCGRRINVKRRAVPGRQPGQRDFYDVQIRARNGMPAASRPSAIAFAISESRRTGDGRAIAAQSHFFLGCAAGWAGALPRTRMATTV